MGMTILIVVVVLLAALLGFAATRPDTFQLQRAIQIDAPPERIFPLINDLRRWRAWSPWERIDPDLKRTYSGSDSGVGAAYEWEGKKAGAGRMEITESLPPAKITIKLDFTKPFEAHNTVDFTVEDTGGATHVVWSMRGQNTYMAKVMQMVVSMDRMVGKNFEKGLAALKAAAEQEALDTYAPQRRAEFLLTNAVDAADYADAVREVRALGLDPDAIPHRRPDA